jgi:translation initiation factor 2 alpha subunit (eIF-2alpha)
MEFQEGQIVLCIVDKIIGTTVFVKIQDNGEGTITTSEIAPGRIRNLRDYVMPGKRIVCKILFIRDGRIQLSLRRVKQSERKDFLDLIDRENSYIAIIRTVLGKENYEKIINEIIKEISISEFLDKAKQDMQVLNKYFTKDQADKIIKILESKKEKPKQVTQIFVLSNKSPKGIIVIKDILNQCCATSNCDISYISAGEYRLNLEGNDFKDLKNQINNFTQTVEKLAKKNNCEFSLEKG